MKPQLAKISDPRNRLSSRAYLSIATLIFGASNAVTHRLQGLGAKHLIDGRNPISFCNSLFVGNLCALILLIGIYHREWNVSVLKQIKRQDWLLLTIVAILGGALAPALIFTALGQTMVNNVILVGRIEPPIALALSIFLLGQKTNIWVIAGAVMAFAGVALTISLQQTALTLGNGELLTAVAALALAISSVISKRLLSRISLGVFSVFRTAIGTLVFGIVVVQLYGFVHFTDALSPFLWQWMLIYSAVIVVGGQLCWLMGLKNSSVADVSIVSSFYPIAGILSSYLILGEVPNHAQYLGGSLIILGIILGQIGVMEQIQKTSERLADRSMISINLATGFKGV